MVQVESDISKVNTAILRYVADNKMESMAFKELLKKRENIIKTMQINTDNIKGVQDSLINQIVETHNSIEKNKLQNAIQDRKINTIKRDVKDLNSGLNKLSEDVKELQAKKKAVTKRRNLQYKQKSENKKRLLEAFKDIEDKRKKEFYPDSKEKEPAEKIKIGSS
jgi:transcriptional regulator of heat shock response